MESLGAKIAIAVIAIILILVIIAVVVMNPDSSDTEKNASEKSETNTEVSNTTEESDIDYMANAEKQMAMPEEGETIAIIHVKDYGDITVKFFEGSAPKAVENFVTHAKEGYYDGVTFHRVMEEFMIQSGDPEGTGSGGESIWGEGFEEEIDTALVPYRGSLCMASTGYGMSSLGSQFFITQANASDEYKSYWESSYDAGLIEAYEKYGGYLSLYGQYTVFGQVIDGMDVVDVIASAEVEESSTGEVSSPVTPIVIEAIEVTTYEG